MFARPPSRAQRARRDRAARIFTTLSASLGCLLLAGSAQASGFELAPPGGRDMGRAGASVVGSDSAIGMFYNPATLLASPSLVDVDVALHLNMQETCFRRVSVIEQDGERSAGETLAKVCGKGGPWPVPETAVAMRFGRHREFAVGLGVYAPATGVRDVKYGDPATARLSSSADAPYAPSRYLLLKENLLQVFPTLGLAYQPHPRLRIGASFGWGVSTFDFSTAAFTRTVVLPPNSGATSEATTSVKGIDGFTPRVQAGLWGKPLENVPVELGLAFTWTQDVSASDSTLRLRGVGTEYYGLLAPGGLLGNLPQPDIQAKIDGVTVKMPMISTLTGGVRYAMKLDKPADAVGDRLSTERFDIEANVSAIFAERLEAINVEVPPTTVTIPSPLPPTPDFTLQVPQRITLEQRWSNQVQLRLGGDVSVLPGRLALRAGASYETHGQKRGYEQLAFTPWSRYGLHAGLTVRIVRWVDVSASYVYFITPTVRVAPGQAQVRRQVSGEPAPGDDQLVNAGTFKQSASSFALQVSARF